MKILLVAVNAKYIHSNPAVYSLRAFAGEFRSSVEIAEFTINQYPDEILREIYLRKPEIAAFSCYIWNVEIIEQVIGELQKVLPEVQIWVGGPEVTYDAEGFLQKHPGVNGVMMGEGEETFRELAACWQENRQPDEIPGICFRNRQNRIVINSPRLILDMNRIPFLYEELTDFEHRIIYYESSRGCPFSCSYCLSSVEKQVRFREVSTVTRELQFFLDRRVPQVKFVDRTFNCRHSHALAIWRYLKEHDNGITNFHFEIAADLLHEEELELLNSLRPGQVQLEIGVQSTNPETIQEVDRIMDFGHLSRVVKRIQKGGNIHQHLDLIAGLPGEDFESFQQSFNDVYRLYPDQLQLGFLKVLKGSEMRRKAEEYSLVYQSRPVYEVLCTNWISYEELLVLKDVEEMLEVYYNSGQFSRTIWELEKEFDSPFALYRSLASYYEKQELRGKNHSRMQRLEILREFIRTISAEPVYDELLVLDLYLRENSKTRPGWAPDLSGEKERLLGFFRQEEQCRRNFPEYEGYSARQMMHMIHAERFSARAACAGGLTAAEEQGEVWAFFDYRNRNPLNQDAEVRLICVPGTEKEMP